MCEEREWHVLEDPTAPTIAVVWPNNEDGVEKRWRWEWQTVMSRMGSLAVRPDRSGHAYVYVKRRPHEEGVVSVSSWFDAKYSATEHGTALLKALFGQPSFSYPKSIHAVVDAIYIGGARQRCAVVLDHFAGSGTTGHAVINLNREDGGRRKFILVEMGDYFDTVLLPRIKKVTFTPEWKDGKPKRPATHKEAERSPRIVKVVRLESYEDALNNLETRRTDEQQLLLDDAEAQGADGLREQYILRYMLDVETRGSQSLLNVQAFTDPTAYKLKVKRPGSDESREVNVDLLETFNWLIGLTVRHIAAPQTFSATFERDSEKRLRLKGCLKQEEDGLILVPHSHRHHARRSPNARHLAQAHRRAGAGQLGARRVVHQAGLLGQGQRVRPHLRQRRQQPREPQDPRRPVEGAAHRRGLPSLDVRDGGGLMAKKKAKATHKKPQVLFTSKLVLNQWLLSLFNVKRFEELAEHLHDEALEGLDENNIHRFHHALTTHHSDLTQLPTELLLEYDQNIVKHTQRLNERRITRGEEPIVWKYFQYLTLLFSEIYLDRYFRDPKALLVELNVQVAAYNADKPEADQIAALDEAAEAWPQLNKLAFWMATGSGKTLLMHATLLTFCSTSRP